MVKKELLSKERVDARWKQFVKEERISAEQEAAFRKYVELLWQWNEDINLTAITQFEKIITDHLQDSLSISQFLDLNAYTMIADVGSGGGFPGIPLAIKFPHIACVLIEVNRKKIAFLEEVIHQLGLKNTQVYPNDWRTFLRKTDLPVDLVVSRASLQPEELVRMFKPASPYNSADLVYWASRHWESDPVVEPFIKQEYAYKAGVKKRRLILMQRNNAPK